MVRFISDLHINDPCMFRWRADIGTVRDYSDKVIDKWNRVVTHSDVTILVGDIGVYCRDTVDVLGSLAGRKILVLGNHDMEWVKHIGEYSVFESIYSHILCSDYMIMHIPHRVKFSCRVVPTLIHGHHHSYCGKEMDSAYEMYIRDPHRLNCSADLINHQPRTANELSMFKAMLEEERRI